MFGGLYPEGGLSMNGAGMSVKWTVMLPKETGMWMEFLDGHVSDVGAHKHVPCTLRLSTILLLSCVRTSVNMFHKLYLRRCRLPHQIEMSSI